MSLAMTYKGATAHRLSPQPAGSASITTISTTYAHISWGHDAKIFCDRLGFQPQFRHGVCVLIFLMIVITGTTQDIHKEVEVIERPHACARPLVRLN